MMLALIFDTDRLAFTRRPTLRRTLGGYVAAWLWFEVRVTR